MLIGVLGAARIAELGIVKPAQATGTCLVAIAARDRERAAAFAAAHGVEKVLPTYEEGLADPEVEAVSNRLPEPRDDPADVVWRNFFLGSEPVTRFRKFDVATAKRIAREELRRMGIDKSDIGKEELTSLMAGGAELEELAHELARAPQESTT